MRVCRVSAQGQDKIMRQRDSQKFVHVVNSGVWETNECLTDMCLPESIVQCYLDQELSLETIERITAHVNACSRCDAAVTDAKEETAIVELALAFEMDLQVPTNRLWARIEAWILAASD